MKFRLDTACDSYNIDGVEDLKVLGFEFELINGSYLHKLDTEVFINFKSLQELVEFTEKWGSLIFNEDSITIYDGYIE